MCYHLLKELYLYQKIDPKPFFKKQKKKTSRTEALRGKIKEKNPFNKIKKEQVSTDQAEKGCGSFNNCWVGGASS